MIGLELFYPFNDFVLLPARWENLPFINKQMPCISLIPIPMRGGRELVLWPAEEPEYLLRKNFCSTASASWHVAFSQGSDEHVRKVN